MTCDDVSAQNGIT